VVHQQEQESQRREKIVRPASDSIIPHYHKRRVLHGKQENQDKFARVLGQFIIAERPIHSEEEEQRNRPDDVDGDDGVVLGKSVRNRRRDGVGVARAQMWQHPL